MDKKIKTIDLFAGCGGLTEGFAEAGGYETVACVEWDSEACRTLRHNLTMKWKIPEEKVLQFDIQKTEELLSGWTDKEYGFSKGLDCLVQKAGGSVDLIIGGPPCQAYSLAGRVRDKDGMKNDYRNYLFESYLRIVQHYRPKAFVFENVPGLLSARPGTGENLICDSIRDKFRAAGYCIIDDLKEAVVNLSEYGVPQNRKRVIILGLSREVYGESADDILHYFYETALPKQRIRRPKTVRDAIGDLPELYPLRIPGKFGKKRISHAVSADISIRNHFPRFASIREVEIFRLLAEDIACGENKYASTAALKDFYTEKTGKRSNVHKYYVLRWGQPSNTIPAHLYKDGLRHIHPDPMQARSITVREAARLQTFPDDFEFITGTAADYKMIGNAVPPLFAKTLGLVLKDLLFGDTREPRCPTGRKIESSRNFVYLPQKATQFEQLMLFNKEAQKYTERNELLCKTHSQKYCDWIRLNLKYVLPVSKPSLSHKAMKYLLVLNKNHVDSFFSIAKHSVVSFEKISKLKVPLCKSHTQQTRYVLYDLNPCDFFSASSS